MNVLSLFNGQYEISEYGNVYSYKRKNKVELIGKVTNAGYRMVIITLNNKKYYINVHRLIAKYFIPNPNNLREVNHIDGDKLNNSVSNLEWVTTRESQMNAIKMGKNKSIKINIEIAMKIREIYSTGNYTYRELSSMFGIGKTNIGYIIKGKRWKQ